MSKTKAQKEAEAKAKAKAEAQAKAKAKADAEAKANQDEKVRVFFVKSVSPNGFRRLGWRFTPEGFGIAEDLLTKEQQNILQKDPDLIVEVNEYDRDEFEGFQLAAANNGAIHGIN